MAVSYKKITPVVARQIKMIMTDIDGTITPGTGLMRGHNFHPEIARLIRRFEECAIPVGFISGRNMPDLETFARELNISGPLVAENGALAKIKTGAPQIKLGFKRDVVDRALRKLNTLFPGALENGHWNRTRAVDLILVLHGVTAADIRKHLTDTELLDSGYVYHLAPEGATKGKTLRHLLSQGYLPLDSPDMVLVMGDAPTDLSLFEAFPLGVQILNPTIPPAVQSLITEKVRYVSESCCEEGFIEVASYILALRGAP